MTLSRDRCRRLPSHRSYQSLIESGGNFFLAVIKAGIMILIIRFWTSLCGISRIQSAYRPRLRIVAAGTRAENAEPVCRNTAPEIDFERSADDVPFRLGGYRTPRSQPGANMRVIRTASPSTSDHSFGVNITMGINDERACAPVFQER